MFRAVAAAGILAVFAGPAQAEPVAYGWSGYGINISGNSKCANYKATLDVTVDGDAIKGVFQHEGRPTRTFETTLKGGKYKTKDVGGTNRMNVEGVIRDGGGTFEIFGYCLFEGKLTKK